MTTVDDDGHSYWRVIITDSESASGVAPVCPEQATPGGEHEVTERLFSWFDEYGVYDCCPQPHLECWSKGAARTVAHILTSHDVKACS